MENTRICEVQMDDLASLIGEITASGGSAEITVTGNSMYPMLRHRRSQVKLAAADTIRIGDVPLYRRENGAYILHRIVGQENGKYVCCGDHQWKLEKGIAGEQIIAVMTHFRTGKHWVSADDRRYRCYWRFWLLIRPLRHCADSAYRRFRRLLQRARRNK